MRDEGKGKAPNCIHPSQPKASRRSEFEFINRIQQLALRKGSAANVSHSSLISHPSSLICGIGDDAAVIRERAGLDLVITADLLVEEIDFRRASALPRLLGHKALAVSLSDIAAMGARPRWALLSIGVPHDIWDSRFLDEFYEGFFALADEHQVTLIGGDVSRTPKRIVIDSIVMGEVKRGRTVLRSGAHAGDHIFVTGALGGSAAGLHLLNGGARLTASGAKDQSRNVRQQLLLRHIHPRPRVAWGALLGEKQLASAMIDLSDGLSSDLAHLCDESGVGARIEASRIPVDPLIKRVRGQAWDELSLALHGGEDFELLFTVRARHVARLPEEVDAVPITYIGDISDEVGQITLIEGGRSQTLKPAGFKHFRRQR